jgi:hypothetical protein
MNMLAGLRRAWTGRPSAFFEERFGADLRSLAALRIGLGILLLADLGLRAVDLTAHYSDQGLLPRLALLRHLSNSWYWSFHLFSGTPQFQGALFLLAGICAAALLVGYRTRSAAVASWILLISLDARNPLVLQGSDVLLRMVLFWGLFLPLGARWSVDRALAPSGGRAIPRHLCTVGTVALFLQVALMYWITAAQKVGAPEWHDGTALYYALSIDEFTRPLGQRLLALPELLRLKTYAVWWFEALGPLALLATTGMARVVCVAAFLALQLGFGLCLYVGLFPWIGAVAMLGFLPSWWWDSARAWWPQLAREGRETAERVAKHPLVKRLEPRPISARPSGAFELLAACLLAYVIWWNLSSVAWLHVRMPQPIRWIGLTFKLEQRWRMFASPMKGDGWFVMPGTLKDGTEVDIWQNSSEVLWQKPERVAETYRNQHWRKYMESIRKERYRRLRPSFGGYLCRQWDETTVGDRQLRQLEIWFVMERTLPGYRTAEPKRRRLLRYTCPD